MNEVRNEPGEVGNLHPRIRYGAEEQSSQASRRHLALALALALSFALEHESADFALPSLSAIFLALAKWRNEVPKPSAASPNEVSPG